MKLDKAGCDDKLGLSACFTSSVKWEYMLCAEFFCHLPGYLHTYLGENVTVA